MRPQESTLTTEPSWPITDLLAASAKLGIRLWRGDGELGWRVPAGAVLAPGMQNSLDRSRAMLFGAATLPARENICLAPLNASSRADANLICIHPLHGTVYDYRHFSGHIAGNYGVYGLHAVGMLLESAPPRSMDEMAERYTDELLKNDLCEKPFVLYGGCTGGFIALQIARRLAARGRPPASLVFGDTRDLSDGGEAVRNAGWWITFVEAFLSYDLACALIATDHEFWSLSPDHRFDYLIETVAALPQTLYSLPLEREVLERHFAQYGRYLTSYGSVALGEYSGRVLFLKASVANWSFSAQLRRFLTGTCVLEDIRGNHVSLFRSTNGAAMAAVLQVELERAASRE